MRSNYDNILNQVEINLIKIMELATTKMKHNIAIHHTILLVEVVRVDFRQIAKKTILAQIAKTTATFTRVMTVRVQGQSVKGSVQGKSVKGSVQGQSVKGS